MKIDSEHRRHAIQIAAALPNDPEDALIVLQLARDLVTVFLSEPEKNPAPVITLIGGNDCA
ncbi:hypothetical protein ACFFWD_03740 [Bradyrhizobium erythrophlei]|uniref:hypothetical protein n=1 Tax=Bradyrhizobium erythrophlei TaxID=1437360 RepID=UPI0035E849BF